MSVLKSISCDHFYYDSTKNPSAYGFCMLKNGDNSISSGVTGKSTGDFKELTMTGFTPSNDFGGYPIPDWTPAPAPAPISPPTPAFSCALTFTGVEDGVLTVKDSEGTALTSTDGVYTLSAAGDYSYSVTFGEDSP